MIEAKIQAIITKLNGTLDDARKVDAGKTGAPGTRVRAVALDVTKDLKDIRVAVSEIRAAASDKG